MPSLTVLLLCWNHTTYLEQCIAALAAQTDRDFDIVFLDNGSSDGSFEQAEALFERHGLRATLIRNKQNERIAPNLNRMLSAATSELVCVLSTDDYYQPRYVEAMRAAAAADPDALWYFGERFEFHQADKRTSGPHRDFEDGDVTRHFNAVAWPINMVGACYRRAALQTLGGWDESLTVEDTDMFYRLALMGRCRLVREPLVTYRVSIASASGNRDFVNQGWREFIAKHRADFPDGGRPLMAEVLRTSAALAIDRGAYRNAARYLFEAFREQPDHPLLARTCLYLFRRAARPSNWR